MDHGALSAKVASNKNVIVLGMWVNHQQASCFIFVLRNFYVFWDKRFEEINGSKTGQKFVHFPGQRCPRDRAAG